MGFKLQRRQKSAGGDYGWRAPLISQSRHDKRVNCAASQQNLTD
jgi:hypothetical protein